MSTTNRRTTWPTAQRLQTAADRIRALADAATPGPWVTGDQIGLHAWQVILSPTGRMVGLDWDQSGDADAAHIASWSPDVARAIADHLDVVANNMAWLTPYRPNETGQPMWESANQLADTILGDAP